MSNSCPFRRSFQFGWLYLVLAGGLAEAEELEPAVIRMGDCVAGFSWKEGVTLSYRQLPIITRSTMSVHDWGSQTVYCHLSRVRPKVRLFARGDAQFLEADYPADRSDPEARKLPFFFAYSLRLEPPHRATISFRYSFREETPAVLDYCVGRFLDTLLVGRSFQAETDTGTMKGEFPWFPPPPGC